MRLLVAVFMLGLLAAPAQASPLFEALGGFGGQGALQARHSGPSAASSYFNPALLPDAPAGVVIGAMILRTEIGISMDARPPGADVPAGLDIGRRPGNMPLPSVPLPTSLLQNGRKGDALNTPLAARPRGHAGTGHQTTTYEAIGIVVPLIEDRLAIGFYGLIPNKSFAVFNTYYSDEREQYSSNSLHPVMYGDRMTAVSLALGLGGRITKTLSAGVGVSIGIRAAAMAPVFVADAGRLDDLTLNLHVKAVINLRPNFGVAWSPIPRLHLTATVHTPERLKVGADFSFILGSGIEQRSGLDFTFYYQPWQAGLGAAYDVFASSKQTWSAVASLLYGRWSKFIDTQSERPNGAYTWSDTIGASAGVRRQGEWWNLAVDGSYQPTPVPLQTGRTNYVDNDRFGLAAAVECPFQLGKLRMAGGLQLQGTRLIARSQTKIPTLTSPDGVNHTPQLVADEVPDDLTVSGKPAPGRDGLQTNNPGWPGFGSSGWVGYGGLYLSLKL